MEVTRVPYSAVSQCLREDQWPNLLSDVEIYSDDRVTNAYRITAATLILSFQFLQLLPSRLSHNVVSHNSDCFAVLESLILIDIFDSRHHFEEKYTTFSGITIC